ncbi:eukaryotic translation initiation factor 2 subunit, putative [Trypanosoma cruzi marinkellei]|uniref:Eukaryotic translation initiation factor 2 subunit, putative n=1 Tax=Trypanosoma cruzi marinkellei TaxID=85056 RepID=K2NTC7_TRYCR|nr:eukaryotic translation initiation factor 2 subunit, putative [Trypanosoma cruzi marinkellei]
MRLARSKGGATLWEAQVLLNAAGRHATVGEERGSGAAQHTFLGVQFNYTHRAVSLSEKFVWSVCAMPALNSSAIEGVEVTASRFLYAAAFLGMHSCDHYFFRKAVRRRLSAPKREVVLETSLVNLPPSAVGLGEGPRHMIENNCRRIIKRTERASAAIVTDASLQGWGAVFIPDSGDFNIAGGTWEKGPFLIMQAGVYPYRPFPPSCYAPWTFGCTTLRCRERRIKAAQNHTSWRGSCHGYMGFGLSWGTEILCLRVVCGEPRGRHTTRFCFCT